MKQTIGEAYHTQSTLKTVFRRYILKKNGNKEKLWLVILSTIPLTINQLVEVGLKLFPLYSLLSQSKRLISRDGGPVLIASLAHTCAYRISF